MVESAGSGPTRNSRLGAIPRRALSVMLVLMSTLAAVAGGVTLYVREEIIDTQAFADHAVDAMQRPALQRVVARQVVVQLVERGSPDLLAARPLIQSVVQSVVASKPFGRVIRASAEHGHRLLFERGGGNAAFDVADAATVAASALRRLSPGLAQKIPRQLDPILLKLRRRSFATETLRFADGVRVLGLVLPLVAIVLFALAIALAPGRRVAITRSAISVGVAGITLLIGLELLRLYVVSHVYGSDELSNSDVRGAVGALWDSYLSDLVTATVVIALAAWLVAAAAASVLKPYSAAPALVRARGWVRAPSSTRGRAVSGVLMLALGLLVILEPTLVLKSLAVLIGAVLLYVGAGEVLSTIPPAQRSVGAGHRRRRRLVMAAGIVTAAAVGGTALALALGGRASNAHASAALTCNGYAQLCNRRLDQVVFAGTHNSMSAADSPGWYIANQDRDVAEQLQDGIRLFKISTHYGVADSAGHVRTDLNAEGKRLNRVADKLSPEARQALQRLGQAVGLGSLRHGKRGIWLCHTLCELGATRMIAFLATIRHFLVVNPGQVIILFDEDYVDERNLQSAFRQSGLLSYLATLHRGQPLPTLGQLIRSGHKVLVFAQKKPSGSYPWDMDAFTWIQDTPLGARTPAQFTCRLNRGRSTNPLMMMNNWADVFPPRPSPNVPLVTRGFILGRARQCVAQGRPSPNLILTDFYNRGDVIGAVRTLNGLDGKMPVPTTAVDFAR
jgi:hypothetical protein